MSLPPPGAGFAALVTGASSGIGSDLARELARRGQTVVLVARRKDRLDELAEEIRADHGVRAEVLACDLGDPEARDGLPARVAELGLKVSILINNAGFGSGGSFVELDTAREAEMVRLNCEAIVALSGAFAPAMVEAERGAILIVASVAGSQPLPGQATYSASKAFALTFSEALHAELRSHGVAVTALCPGPVKTEFFDAEGLHGLDKTVPQFAWVDADEVARQAIAGLADRRRVVTPGLTTRVTAAAGRFTPRSVLLPLANRFYPT